MVRLVSKVRARKTKSREKQTAKGLITRRSPLPERPVMGFCISLLLWAFTVFFIAFPQDLPPPSGWRGLLPLTGKAIILLIALFATGLFLNLVQPALIRRNSRVALLSLVSLVSLAMTRLIVYACLTTGLFPLDLVQFLVPALMTPILATLLVGSIPAIAIGIWTSLAASVMTGSDLTVFQNGILATILVAVLAREARTRSRVIRVGILVGFVQVASVVALAALRWPSVTVMDTIRQAGASLVSGFFSAVLALLILPVFEHIFHVTTNITLLEFADLGHPVLQKLAIEAPGTYHHSLVVANLAQAAADEIGANSLLARIAAYFHDIGKLVKPDFFAENIQHRQNPHDDLPPSMSTLVITSHVKEGLSLAVHYKLPAPVTDVIQEHHGNSLLSFFHHKACEQVNEERSLSGESPQSGAPNIDESDFRYNGPRPSGKESAIVCLADAVEAASRSLEKTTPTHIENLVDEIVNNRLLDGQLDACGLTLAELSRIKQSFVFSLTNMLHGRIAYPKDENRDKQQTKTVRGERTPVKPADRVPGVSGPTTAAAADAARDIAGTGE